MEAFKEFDSIDYLKYIHDIKSGRKESKMKRKVTVFTVFFIIFLILPAETKKIQYSNENLDSENIISHILGLVMIIDLKLIHDIPTIQRISILPGLYNKKREHFEEINRSIQDEKLQLFLLDIAGNIIYKTEFYFPRIMTVPPAPPEFYDPYTPSILLIEEPEISIVTPYYAETEFVEVINSIGYVSSAIPRDEQIDTSSLLMFKESVERSNKFNILIMASNYDSSNMANFTSVANSLKQFLLTREPFSYFYSLIKINIYSNTQDLGCETGCSGIERLICCDLSKVIAAAASSGYFYDEIIVIHNTDQYGGGGYREIGDAYKSNSYNTYAITYGGTDVSDSQIEVAMHEFGHSFGNLCDEYSYTTEGYTFSDCVNCRPNCSDWNSITDVCQVGCDAESGYFRPDNSIMLSIEFPYFNQVSIKAKYFPDGLEKRLKYFVGESSYTLTLTCNKGGTTNPSPGDYYFAPRKRVKIKAIPHDGYRFKRWRGALSGGKNPIRIKMDSNKKVKAIFKRKKTPASLLVQELP